MRKTINKLFLIITVISALLLTTGCDLFIKTNKGQVDQKWYMGLTYEDDNGNRDRWNYCSSGFGRWIW